MMPQEAPVPIPHHPQETDYTCGPAALKMVLDALWGLHVEEEGLAQHLGTEPGVGTRQRVMARFLDGLGLRAVVRHTDTRVHDIREAMRTGHVVLVCYWLPEEATDHYAVVARVLADHIVLQDPWKGPDWTLGLEAFERDWRSDEAVATRRHRWFVAVEVPQDAGGPPVLPVPYVPSPTARPVSPQGPEDAPAARPPVVASAALPLSVAPVVAVAATPAARSDRAARPRGRRSARAPGASSRGPAP